MKDFKKNTVVRWACPPKNQLNDELNRKNSMDNPSLQHIKYKTGLFYSFLSSSLIAVLSVLILIIPDLSSKTILDYIAESLVTIMVWILWLGITAYAVMISIGIPVFILLKKIRVLSFINYVFAGSLFGYSLATNLIKPQITSFDYVFPYVCALYGFACSAAFYIGYEKS